MGKAKIKLEVGMKFNKWTLLEETKQRCNAGQIFWKCRCDCGNERLVRSGDIRRGKSKSCGNCNHIIDGEDTDYLMLEITDRKSVKHIFLFDNEDIDIVKSFKWNVKQGYAVSTPYEDNEKRWISLHREIIKKHFDINSTDVIDHKNRQRNDNRKSNLNIVTSLENAQNASIRKDNTSEIKGVSFRKDISKWGAYINFNKTRQHLGFFDNKEDAIKARQEAEKEFHKYNESLKNEQVNTY